MGTLATAPQIPGNSAQATLWVRMPTLCQQERKARSVSLKESVGGIWRQVEDPSVPLALEVAAPGSTVLLAGKLKAQHPAPHERKVSQSMQPSSSSMQRSSRKRPWSPERSMTRTDFSQYATSKVKSQETSRKSISPCCACQGLSMTWIVIRRPICDKLLANRAHCCAALDFELVLKRSEEIFFEHLESLESP